MIIHFYFLLVVYFTHYFMEKAVFIFIRLYLTAYSLFLVCYCFLKKLDQLSVLTELSVCEQIIELFFFEEMEKIWL